MTQSLTMNGSLEESHDRPDAAISFKRRKSTVQGRVRFRKIFNLKRVRTSTVYVLLMASILLSVLTAIATYTKFSNEASVVLEYMKSDTQRSTYQPIGSSGVTRFSSFALLTLTCSIALVSIIRRDKLNARLLAKLKSTNRQLNEEVQIRTSLLTEAIKAKDHFMGVAAHDLKAPLCGIEGLVELVKIENKNMSPRQAEYLGHIQYSCKKMQRLIIDILDINRIEQGKATMNWQKVSVMRMLGQIQIGFAALAAKKNIDFHIEGVDATIETDADNLTRVLDNLLSNAIKFSPSMKKVWLNVSLEAEEVKFEVVDEGPGIPPEEQHKLFNKFQRLSNRPTNSEISTGLGLSIVKELVAQLGGEITFKSEVGKGTTFVVRLPTVCSFVETHGRLSQNAQAIPVGV